MTKLSVGNAGRPRRVPSVCGAGISFITCAPFTDTVGSLGFTAEPYPELAATPGEEPYTGHGA